MKQFVRITKLSDIRGRADYISNPQRQEAIVAKSESIDWQPYHEYEQKHQKTSVKNNEGREIIIALPNDWSKLTYDELYTRAEFLSHTAIGKTTDLQWAIHWNKAHTNLHLHIIFSERHKEKSLGRWDRDIYLTDDDKIARRKADRAKNLDGTDKPPIYRKGEEKGGFSAKDTRYKEKAWLPQLKAQLKSIMHEQYDIQLEEKSPLHEYHEGKGKEALEIKIKNQVIRENNTRLKDLTYLGINIEKNVLPAIKLQLKNKYIVALHFNQQGQIQLTRYKTPKKALEQIKNTENTWINYIQTVKHPSQEHLSTNPTFSFTALIAAQKNYYQEIFALYDKRTPLNSKVTEAPKRFEQLKNEFLTAKLKENELFSQYTAYSGLKGIFHSTEKKTAQSEYLSAKAQADKLGERLAEGMSFSTPLQRDEFIHYPILFNKPTDTFLKKYSERLNELYQIREKAYQHARPNNALNGSQERTKIAKKLFEQLCKEIPPEQQETARTILQSNIKNLNQGYPFADVQANSKILKEIRLLLPTIQEKQQERKCTKQYTKSKGWDR